MAEGYLLLVWTLSVLSYAANAQQKTCIKQGRFNCLYNIPGSGRTQQRCRQLAPYCRWCGTLNTMRLCQVHNRACLVHDNIEVPGNLNQAECERQGHVYCWGDVRQKCVYQEPVRSLCFKKFTPSLCTASGDLSTEYGCHKALCVWCGAGSRTNTLNKCLAMPRTATCPVGKSCCKAICSSDISRCDAKGCTVCYDGGVPKCAIQEPDSTLPAACPAVENAEDCFAGIQLEKTEQLCQDLCCKWCSETGVAVCKRDSYPSQCSLSVNTRCPVPDLDTCPDCKSHGCEWCGPSTNVIKCQAATICTTCSCTTRTECCAATFQACELKGCMWCESATDFQCMNVDSSGVIGAGVWTICTRTCGGGSQWQYDASCSQSSFFMCPRIHRSCNAQSCTLPICPQGEMQRHVESGTCCMSHTWTCGRNPYNTIPTASGGSRRKKRVVGGDDIASIENLPWIALIYIDGTRKCTGTVISDRHVVTHASCFTDPYTQLEIIVHQYDRAMTPNVTRGFTNVATLDELSIILLDTPLGSDEYNPLCLPGGEFPLVDTHCIVAGWGLTVAGDNTSCATTPHAATVRTMLWGLCDQAWGSTGITQNNHFCAGIPEGGPDACTGDKGDALMCQRCANCGWYLAGIATPDHVGCGTSQTTTVYVKVANYESTLFQSQSVPMLDPGPYSCS